MKSRKEVWKRVKEDWRRYRSGILAAGAALAVLSLLGKGVCPLAGLWGFPCPGCGMTRSLALGLAGRWQESWQMHPFLIGWILFIAAAAVERYLIQRNGKWKRAVLIVLAAGMLIWYIYRMTSVFPDVEPYIYIEGNMMERILPGYKEFVHHFIDGR